MKVLDEHQQINENENHTERIVQFLIGNEIELALKAFEKR
ncbi:hypothetical protein SSUD12_1846 [Streptococcus suis D12]|uniref:Uncharacterized protein n=1 Tax=Streptococcus suis D12 TaxID=1004952 RepID=G7SIE6_STRSU|nr:hypothetical protein SSUD12_1846 [Streptococcus suis D12]